MNSYKYISLLIMAMILCIPAAQGIALQTEDVSGLIVNKNDTTITLGGASIIWMNAPKGVKADPSGRFVIVRNTAKDSALIVSYVGYKKDTIIIANNQEFITIGLQEDAQLSNVIVEEKGASILNKAEIKTEKISSRQLQESACCSLAESFERSPSVEVSYTDAATGSKMIQLLGLKGLYTQQLQEAIPGMRGLAMPFGMDFVPGAFLESISISKGAASVMNGYEGITGQINIEYLKPLTSPRLLVNAYANQMQRYELNLASAFEPAKNWYGMVMAHGSIFEHEVDGNDDGFIDMPLFKKSNLTFRIEHRGRKIEFQAFAKGIVDKHTGGISGMHVHEGLDSIQATPAYLTTSSNQRVELFSKLGFLELEHDWAQSVAFQFSGAYHDIQSEIGPKNYSGKESTFLLKGIVRAEPHDEHSVMYGFSMLFDDYNEQFLGLDRLRTEFVPGVFFEDTFVPNDDITIVMGLRADFHSLYGTIITPRIHAKYSPNDLLQVRVSAGTGMRVANPLIDNLSAFVNNRRVYIDSVLNPEKAWNAGISATYTTSLLSMPITLDAELYHTRFSNQVNVDYDYSARDIRIINDSNSYATSAMLQVQSNPWDQASLNIAWRYNDVWLTTGNIMQRRAMLSPHRALVTFSQSMFEESLRLDITTIWNSGGRIPSTKENPETLQMLDEFPDFTRVNAQITWKQEAFDVYLGAENIFNTLQNKVVIDGMRPDSKYFDASLVWGVLDNQMFYVGIRTQLN